MWLVARLLVGFSLVARLLVGFSPRQLVQLHIRIAKSEPANYDFFCVSRAKRGVCFWHLMATTTTTPTGLEKHLFLKLVTQWGWR